MNLCGGWNICGVTRILITIAVQNWLLGNCVSVLKQDNLSRSGGEESNKENGVIWTHHANFSNEVTLRWSSTDPIWLTMEMSAPTTGYVAVGFSPSGGMTGADIVMGWVDEQGKGHIKDLHGIGNTTPLEDPVQNYELISFSEANHQTTVIFKRKWNTCDSENDIAIAETDSVRLIYAFNNQDPVSVNGTFRPKYHYGIETRGLSRTYMRIPITSTTFPDANQGSDSISEVKYWDVGMDNNTVDGEDDVLFCKILSIPKINKKHHMIGMRPIIQKENKYNIHHMILYECIVPTAEDGTGTKEVFEKYVGQPGVRCWVPSTPADWGKYCVNIPVLWTSGSEGNMFPENMGFPLGEENGGATYFKFEIHYDNPQFKTISDNSGLRLFYTDKLREFDGSVLTVGHKISPFETVPPSMGSFTAKGVCTAECTQQSIPKTGITAVAVLLHAHTTARKITLQHIRNGVELEPIGKDTHYDYNYQQSRVLLPKRVILPGDVLITTCEYNTTSRDSPMFGGLGTRDEMCTSFIHYYPKIALDSCKTMPEFHSYLSALGISKVRGKILNEINLPYKPKANATSEYPDNPFHLMNSTYKNQLNALDVLTIVQGISSDVEKYSTVGALIRGLNWADPKIGKVIEQKWLQGKHYAFCTGGQAKRIPLKDYVVKLQNSYIKYNPATSSTCG